MPSNYDLNKPLIVVTSDTCIYRLGKTDKSGERSIVSDNVELDFRRCKIYNLIIGDPLDVIVMDGPNKGKRRATLRVVISIKQEKTN